jgi:hypothetical protein
MSDQIQTILLFTCLALGFLLLWAASIAVTYWDASRRKLPASETVAWIALAALIPLIGAFAYLFSRALNALFSPEGQGQPPQGRRFTLLKRSPQPEADTGTLLASDLLPGDDPAARPPQPDLAPATLPGLKPAAHLTLKAIDGPHAGTKYPIYRLPAQIGRVPEATVCLEQDLAVSRHHAELYTREGELRIRDLDSAHGTRLGGVDMKDGALAPGDQVQVGLTTLVLQMDEETW